MTVRPDVQEMNAFVDAELDVLRQREVDALMRDDHELRTQADTLRSVRAAVGEHADYHAAPQALRARIGNLVAANDGALPSAGASAASRSRQRWFAWRPLALSFGTLAAASIALNLVLLQPGRDDRVADEIVASHVRATLSQRLVDVESSDHHVVKPWLSSKLDFSPPVDEPGPGALSFVGARVDYVDGRPVAALVYRQGRHVLDAFVWPTSAPDRAAAIESQRGFWIAQWSRDGMRHWLVSDLGHDEFKGAVRELERLEAQH